MLQFLKVNNLGLIDEMELEFQPGFTAITGETGAGKSMLIGALSLLSGARADRSLIRRSADFCEVQAALWFSETAEVDQLLESLELPRTEEGNLLLVRKIQETSGQKIKINGQIATLSQLQKLGEYWLELHGPDAPLALFTTAAQLDLLDAYVHAEKECEAYLEAYRHWRDVDKKIEKLLNEGELSEDERIFLQSQIDEIRSLQLSEEWVEKLELDYRRLSHAKEISERLVSIEDNLLGNDSGQDRLSEAFRHACKLRDLVPEEVESQVTRLDQLMVEVTDLASEFQTLRNKLEIDSYEIEEIESNMQQWMQIRRRHGSSAEKVLQKCKDMQERIDTHANLKSTLERLQKEKTEAEECVRAQGEKLRKKRVGGAGQLAERVRDLLGGLGFRKPKFEIEVRPEDRWSERGTSTCEFLFSGTAGQPLQSLAKVASSGEIARVTLALKAALAEVDRTAVLVFDEIDANVGGEVGKEIGRELAVLAHQNQVFTITHLPQVAAVAQGHFVIEKEQEEDAAHIRVASLSGNYESRIAEIARMLGNRRSKTALSHAKELLAGCP